MEYLPKEILEPALQLYLKYGIKSITMDDVAKELGISKKTLYQQVEGKDELVKYAVRYFTEVEKLAIGKLQTTCTNAIEEIFAIGDFLSKYLINLNPVVLYDLKKYYPEAWKIFQEHKKNYVVSILIKNMQSGRKEGLYRADFDLEIIAYAYISKIEVMMDSELAPLENFNFPHIIKELQQYHIRGIASEKGLAYLKAASNGNKRK